MSSRALHSRRAQIISVWISPVRLGQAQGMQGRLEEKLRGGAEQWALGKEEAMGLIGRAPWDGPSVMVNFKRPLGWALACWYLIGL